MSSLNGDIDHHMLSTNPSPVDPLSASDDGSDDTNMQVDSDLDIHKLPDADADGEDDDDDVDITPADTSLPIASTSYHSNRTVSTCRQVSVSKQKKVPSVLSKVLQMKDDDSVCYWRLPSPSLSFVAYVLA